MESDFRLYFSPLSRPKRFSSNKQLTDLFTECRVSLIEEELYEGGHRG